MFTSPATPLGRRFIILLWTFVIVWTIILTIMLSTAIISVQRDTQEIARAQAHTRLDVDQILRVWASQHGGVYVPMNARTPPNPYLAHIPERDIVTPSGVQLTLMNPAYILRQFGQEFGAHTGTEGRITSLKPLNPLNAPDEWERDALMQLERGASEVSAFTEKNRAPVLRAMRPMITEAPCLKCHAFQGYQVGDVRGGIAVTMPITDLLAQERQTITAMASGIIGLWLIGLLGFYHSMKSVRAALREQTRAQDALRESETKYRIVADNTYDWEYWVGPDQRFRYVSPSCQRTTGYPAADFIADPGLFIRIVHPNDSARIQTHLELREEITPAEIEFRIRTADGDERWIGHVCQPVFDDAGNFAGRRGSNRDITDRKHAQDALRESEERYRRLVEGSPDIAHEYSTQRGGIFYSTRVATVLGYPPATLYAQPQLWHNSIHPDDLPRVDRAIDEFQTGKAFEIEYRIRDAHGHWHWFLDRSIGRKTNQDESIIQGLATDITERKILERELQTEHDFAMTVMDTMGQGLTVTDADSRFVYVNRAYAEMTGHTREELIGKRPADATVIEDHAALARARAERRTGKTSSYETRFRRADGSIVTALITGVPRWIDGQVVGAIAVVTNLTEQKRFEEQLKYLGTHDPLTGVYNRAFFETELARLGASRALPVSIVVADVDNMKITNDTRGHPVGDELLKRTARVFQAVFRASDIIARIGGDEFALILPDTDALIAAGMITRVRENLAALNSQSPDLDLSLSLGVATTHDGALEEIFKIADARMYADKRAHKA